MTFQRINGAEVAKKVREEVAAATSLLINDGIRPGLTVVLVGQDPASMVYVRNKIKACAEVGFASRLIEMPATTSQEQLLATLDTLNRDPEVDGILVQLPLPAGLDSHVVIEAINPAKDVDGFHVSSAGALMTGRPGYVPCTPAGIMRLLSEYQVPLRGAYAVVVGASNIVGKPIALLLQQAGATVTICNSKTRDLRAHTRQADIVVMAVGRPKMLKGEDLKPGAVVIDVGINRTEDGQLCGDVDFASASEVAGQITPVPGGVGPMTIAMLLQNTLISAQARHAARRA